jgi:pilus assembly protein CpaE
VPASAILLLGADPAAADAIRSVLASAGYPVSLVTDADAAFRGAAAHQLVIIDAADADRSPIDVCREIRGTPALAAIPILCISQSDDVEERIRFLEAGADDVVRRPFDARELEARVEALLLRFHRSRDLTPNVAGATVLEKPKRIAVVFSPKGGVGTTTVAVNVAVATALDRPDRVAIADLDLQFGQVATHLNLTAKQTLADLVRDELSLREPELLRTYATRHESGLRVYAAPTSPDLAETISAAHVERFLESASIAYDHLVVDAGSTLDERVMVVLERADVVVLPVYPEMSALKAMASLVEYLGEAGSTGSKVMFVLNGMFAREVLKLRDVESALGARVAAELPYDAFLYLKSVNEGIPVVTGAPRSLPAQRLTRLAGAIFGPSRMDDEPNSKEKKGGLFGGFGKRP